jgi:hypothetical protein
MKNINHQEVMLDIEKRMKFFDEIRINKILTKEKKSKTEIKKDDFVDKKSHLTVVKEDLIVNDISNNELFFEKAEKSEGLSKTENLITEDIFQKELVFEKRAKIEGFTKKDDFFLKDDDKDLVKQKKEATKSFFKTITNFFDGKSNDDNLVEMKQEVIDEIQVEKVESESQKEIAEEEKIKAEKLILIEEEYKLKAEKREAEEKLFNEKIALETKKTNADFRKNKRKK